MNAAVPLLEKVSRATVGLHSQVPASHVSAALGLGTDRRGTGTIISPDGYIVTVHYLLLGAQNVAVTLPGGEQVSAQIIGKDYNSGLGLLKMDGSQWPWLEVVSSQNCAVGEETFTVSSLGGDKRCADAGMVTYTGPFDAMWEFVLDRCVCVTASSLNIGFSGAPVCDGLGRVIAVSYLNFAEMSRPILGIPGECYLAVRDELIRYGRCITSPSKAWVGLLTYTLREHVVVAGVMPGSPGDKAGLQQGDLVITADGRDISERRILYDVLGSHQPGDNIRVKVLRDNRIFNFEIPAARADDYFA